MNHFFSCDWGTTSFRLRRVNVADGSILAERREPSGVKALFSTCPAGDTSAREKIYAAFLREQLFLIVGGDRALLDGAVVMISGMASSSVGWLELSYAKLPVGLDGSNVRRETFDLDLGKDDRIQIQLISGLRSNNDVMRGEEIEICGLFANARHSSIANKGIVVLPGTHSKHVRLQGGCVIGFHTYMTGELFEVIASHSLLRASIQTAVPFTDLNDTSSHESFVEGVHASGNAGLAQSLFQTRSRALLSFVSPAANRWFLSGLLIGAEVADLCKSDLETPILLGATEPQSTAYRIACESLGLSSRLSVEPPEEMALASVRGQLALLKHDLESKK